MSDNEPMNIYQRINEVRKEVEYIQKDKEVQGYKAVTHDMVTARVRDSLIKHGVTIVPSVFSSDVIEAKTAGGKPKIRYQVKYEMAIVNVDNPSDQFIMIIEAHADDQGDKAPGKALSYAKKYAILKLFDLETGEDDESRVGDERRGYTANQKLTFDNLIKDNDSLALRVLELTVDEDVMKGLFNSFPPGQKSKGKERCRELCATGSKQLLGIEAALESGDYTLASESYFNMSNTGKTLLERHIGSNAMRELMALLEEADRESAA
ncbi:MAG: ERF family protein [Candidatus Thiodiazotropha lotti]|nr:ERF family protein [Candidatus Thiodiazotropha lotti]